MLNNKIIGLVIPLRFNSERLQGKVLMDISGKKQIEWIIERSLKSKYLDCIVLAVSEIECDEIANWYFNEEKIFDKYNEKVLITYGSHNDLMTRTLEAIEEFNLDIIVSASGDCTFIDSILIDKCIERLFEYKADYSANCITRSFPDGFDIQVHTKEIYERVEEIIPLEHSTRMWTAWNIFYWREKLNPKPKIINLEVKQKYYYPEWRLCLDTIQDKWFIEQIQEHFKQDYLISKEYPSYKEIIKYLIKNKKLLKINNSIKSTELLQEEIK